MNSLNRRGIKRKLYQAQSIQEEITCWHYYWTHESFDLPKWYYNKIDHPVWAPYADKVFRRDLYMSGCLHTYNKESYC